MIKPLATRRLLFALLGVAVVMAPFWSMPNLAQAGRSAEVRAVNDSDRAVYYTFWWSYVLKRDWSQAGGVCLLPGKSHTQAIDFNGPWVGVPQISVWAEVKDQPSSCAGGTVWKTDWHPNRPRLQIVVVGSKGIYGYRTGDW